MIDKEYNAKIARMIVSSPFWRPEYFPEYFTDEFTMVNNAPPPGMPNYFDFWEAERCLEWLNRTVRTWETEVEEFYTTPDPEKFWAVGNCGGDVRWGEHDGSYRSNFVCRIEMKDGKVNHIKFIVEPIRMLKAAGLHVEPLRKGLNDPRVDAWLESHPDIRKNPINKIVADQNQGKQDLDMSEEAIQTRRKYNLEQLICGVEREKYRRLTTAGERNSAGGAWFIPDAVPWNENPDEPEMVSRGRHNLSLDEQVRAQAWMKASSPWQYRDTRGRIYPTDDKNVWFLEVYWHGPARWIGSGDDHGHYHENYMFIVKFDDAGRIIQQTEILNPIYKYNAVNVSLPSFPYYY